MDRQKKAMIRMN